MFFIELAIIILFYLYVFIGMFYAIPYLRNSPTPIKRGILAVSALLTVVVLVRIVTAENPYTTDLTSAIQHVVANTLAVGCSSIVILASCHKLACWVMGK